MSIGIMSSVWDISSLGGTELLLLLAIADFANNEGVAYPSVATLAKKIRMSERNTHYLLKKLEGSGELAIERNAGPKGCNLFRVQTLQGADFAPVQRIARGGATGSTKGVQPIAPEPSLNHQEPSVASTSTKTVEILAYLNEKTGRSYKPVKANISLIAARLKEGATPEECRAVIDAKAKSWLTDTKMAQYLRPATLFAATNYAQYSGELSSATPLADNGRDWE